MQTVLAVGSGKGTAHAIVAATTRTIPRLATGTRSQRSLLQCEGNGEIRLQSGSEPARPHHRTVAAKRDDTLVARVECLRSTLIPTRSERTATTIGERRDAQLFGATSTDHVFPFQRSASVSVSGPF